MIRDALEATVQLLRDDGDVAQLVGARVYGDEIPAEAASAAPAPCVVIRHAAGQSISGGYVELQSPGFDVYCYGATHRSCAEIYAAVYKALKYVNRKVVLGALLHSYTLVGSPASRTDPETQWPYLTSTWQSLASEKEAT